MFVGHSIIGDFEALGLDKVAYIDTTYFKFKSDQNGRIRKLKDLVKEHVDMEIQCEYHSSLQDATATMKLFLKFKDHPERFFSDGSIQIYS